MTTSNPKVIKINKRKAIKLLEEAVAERGADYVYGDNFGGCVYATIDSKDGQPYPACIVGLALNKAGVAATELFNFAGDVEYIATPLREMGVELSASTVKAWQQAQLVQDGSTDDDSTWGNALEAARKVAYGEPGQVND